MPRLFKNIKCTKCGTKLRVSFGKDKLCWNDYQQSLKAHCCTKCGMDLKEFPDMRSKKDFTKCVGCDGTDPLEIDSYYVSPGRMYAE